MATYSISASIDPAFVPLYFVTSISTQNATKAAKPITSSVNPALVVPVDLPVSGQIWPLGLV